MQCVNLTIKEALNIATNKIQSEDNRRLFKAEILLCNLLKKERIFLHSHDNLPLSKDIFDLLLKQIEILNTNYPIEYITQKVGFFSHEFFISEGVLIPRPETEILIEKASKIIAKYNLKQVYEIGVGSGVISIILALQFRDLRIVATDISPKAIEVAKANISLKMHLDSSLRERITLIQTNLLDNVAYQQNSLIVSNPPYISQDYALPSNVAYEPKEALFGGKNGDEILKKIIALNPQYLCCEIGYNQGYLKDSLKDYNNVEFYKDYAGLLRGFVACK